MKFQKIFDSVPKAVLRHVFVILFEYLVSYKFVQKSMKN